MFFNFTLSFCISNMVYSIFFDTVFHGHTPGKKLVGYNGLGENEKEHDVTVWLGYDYSTKEWFVSIL